LTRRALKEKWFYITLIGMFISDISSFWLRGVASAGAFSVEKEPASTAAQDCFLLWNRQKIEASAGGAINKLWNNIDDSVQKSCKKYDFRKKTLQIEIPPQKLEKNGFKINGIEFYFPKGVSIGAKFTYAVSQKEPKSFQLKSAVFKFSKPVLSYCNFKVNLSLGEAIGGALGMLTIETLEKIVENISIEPYSKSDTGAFKKPMVVAFDLLEVRDNFVGLRITSQKYLRDGWGVFSFGASEKDCVGANTRADPSYFLGDGFGGEGSEAECRSTLVGPRFGRPMVKWLMKVPEWKNIYDKYLKLSNGDSVFALVETINFALGSGINIPSSSWDKIAKEEALLGSGFNIWQENIK